MTSKKYFSVLIPVPSSVGEAFTYLGDEAIEPGERVEIMFGRRKAIGYVVGEAAPYEGAREILRRVDGRALFSKDIIELTRWVSRRYFAPWYRCMEAAVPAGLKMNAATVMKHRRVLALAMPLAEVERKITDERLLSAIRMISAHPDSMTISEVSARFEITRGRIDTLVRNEVLATHSIADRRSPFRGSDPLAKDFPRTLNQEQAQALELILHGSFSEVLLMGVTGSGKTEVYLQAIEHLLAKNQGAIVLVPEISLTPQTVDRFRSRLGETVAILHSGLSQGERFDEWMRIKNGEARVVVGARSAVFAPIEKLGLIVIDEAHEGSYKQSDSPRYNAIDVARQRAAQAGARLVLGTATPLCEMIYRVAVEKVGVLSRLTKRVAARPLPETSIVDMRQELADGNRSIFSVPLLKALRKVLDRGEQAILFLNRRGHASFILCRSCGRALKCPLCSVSLTLHGPAAAGDRRHTARNAAPDDPVHAPTMICHFCNHRSPMPSACPDCSSTTIKPFGAGTQRIEEELLKILPGARVVRMDADTTVKKGSHRKILSEFAAGDFDILVGTQMIGKGLDLPNVTLVGVMAADSSLHIPDFRAAERTFDILVQVAGRAGRDDRIGKAIIQTYVPDHYAVRLAASHDVDAFLRHELGARKAAGMPPYSRMIQWTYEAPHEALILDAIGRMAEVLRQYPGVLSGPAPAPREKLRGRYRWQIRWIFDPALSQETIAEAVGRGNEKSVDALKDLRISIDVDPYDLL